MFQLSQLPVDALVLYVSFTYAQLNLYVHSIGEVKSKGSSLVVAFTHITPTTEWFMVNPFITNKNMYSDCTLDTNILVLPSEVGRVLFL